MSAEPLIADERRAGSPGPAAQVLSEGWRLYRAGRKDLAAKTFRFAVKQDPACAEAWQMLGVLALERGAIDEAEPFARRALELDPENARYLHNLGSILSTTADVDEAAGLYRKALEIKPDYAEAYFNLAALVRATPGEPAVAAVERLLAGPDLPPQDRCVLGFAAGKFRDDLGQFDRAFAHYRDANAAKGAGFAPESAHRLFDAIAAVFNRDLFAARRSCGVATDLPVFVVGMPRSGTSLVEQILASHPAVHGAGERNDVTAITRAIARHHPAGVAYPEGVRDLSDAVLGAFAGQYVETLAGLAPDARRLVDKHPLNFRHLGLIALMFSGARVIHCRRHPLDTCLSCYFQNFANGQEYSFDQFHLGFYYRLYRRLMDHWGAVLPLQVLHVDYEDLVDDQERVSRAMIDFLGLDWHPDCLAFHRTRRPVRTGSRWQVRQPLYRRSAGRWRRYERHLGLLKEALGPVLDEV